MSDQRPGQATANMRMRGDGATPDPSPAEPGTLGPPAVPAPPGAVEPMIGVRLAARYRLVRKLGQGGMGEVYEAIDERLGLPVAVKCITRAIPGALEELKTRFFREVDATVMAQVQGQEIVRVSDKGVDDTGRPYFVMELVRGSTLKETIQAGPLDQGRALHLLELLLKGVHAAHDAKVLHRDLKPGNLMVVRDAAGDEFIKILDFGIAKPLAATTGQHTHDGMVVGTPGYIAPEAAAGSKSAQPRMDVYALGVIAYEMLSGHSPWSTDSPSALLREQQGATRAPRLRDAAPTTPLWLEDLVAKAMSVDPLARFQTAAEMLAVLRASVRPQTVRIDGVGDLQPGTVAADGAYEIVKKVGEGGMAVVYEARDRSIGRRLALKFLREELTSPEIRTRFLNDGRLGAKIDHPGIVRVYGVGEWRGHPYLALELVEGEPLRTRLTNLSFVELGDVVAQVGEALDAVHEAGVVHRDVTPENILIDRRGRARLVDFGIARDDTSALTRSSMGGMVGRYGYMAPEQAKSPRAARATADQWSLAAIAYEALSGLPPHMRRDDDPEDFDRFFSRLVDADHPPPAPSELQPAVPPAMSDVVMRGLATEPTRRFGSAGELGRMLAVATRSPVPPAVAVTTARVHGTRRSGVLLAGAAVVMATVAVLGWRVVSDRVENAERQAGAAAATAQGSKTVTDLALNDAKADRALSAKFASDAGVAPSAPGAPAADAKKVTISLRSEPAGATARIDGKRVKLPIELERPAGTTLAVVVEKSGYHDEPRDLQFDGTGGDEVVQLTRRGKSGKSGAKPPAGDSDDDEGPFVKPTTDGTTVKPQ